MTDTRGGVGSEHVGEERADKPERLKHMFDPWLDCSNRLVEVLGAQVYGTAFLDEDRKRRIRAADKANREAIVKAIFANLAYAAIMRGESPAVGISLRASKQRKTRYDREGFTGLPRIVGFLSEPGQLLQLQKSRTHGFASAITARGLFGDILRKIKFGPDDFSEAPGRETIVLSKAERDAFGNVQRREPIDYQDTPETRQLREEMGRVNAFLEKPHLQMNAESDPEPSAPVPTGLRSMRRVFNLLPDAKNDEQRFDLGGRLFGGWWLNLPKARRPAIRIQGQPIADLDFASMFLRLAYAEVGEEAPAGDLYAALPALSEDHWRMGVKKVVLAMLFRSTPLTRFPRDTRGLLPVWLKASELRAAILKAHPALSEVFETGIGLRLMHTESRILIRALLALCDNRIPALPMHDGLMVPQPKADKAIDIMGDASEAIMGQRLPIALKSLH